MNKLSILIFFAISLVSSCSTTTNDKKNNSTENRMEFSVMEVHQQQKGQVLLINDEQGDKFITIIKSSTSQPLELKSGDKISLIAEAFKESNPVQIISRDIRIVSSASPSSPEYKKIEEVIYWIHAKKVVANDVEGSPIYCLQFHTEKDMNEDAQWQVVCDEIVGFDYEEGSYYQIRVLKKWLKEYMADRSPYDLELKKVLVKKGI